MLTITDIVSLLEEATQSMPGTIDEGTELAGLEGWDSMGMVVFMGLVKERAGVELRVHELGACPTGQAVLELIAKTSAE